MGLLPYILAAAIDNVNAPVFVAGLLLATAGFIFFHSKRYAIALVVSCGLALLLSAVLKTLFAVPRLDAPLVELTGYRFPSQHALVAGAFFASVCFSAFCLLRSPQTKTAVALFSLSAIGIVAWSRVFLRAHMPIDVVIGALLGISISLVVHFFILRKKCWCVG